MHQFPSNTWSAQHTDSSKLGQMWLIHTSSYKRQEFSDPPAYAIFSHRWLPSHLGEELSFQEFSLEAIQTAASLAATKIRDACQIANGKGILWMWFDTCCIDKTNGQAYATAINSMYVWYARARTCIAYLEDVEDHPKPTTRHARGGLRTNEITKSNWFTRGWTLQELLAPLTLEFYDYSWKPIGTKQRLAAELQRPTRIDIRYLQDPRQLETASIAEKFSWMAGRTTSRVEDIAYSMVGLLGVTLTVELGEGVEAFFRLQQTLVSTSQDESIFAWKTPKGGRLACFNTVFNDSTWGLLAPSPDCFSHDDIIRYDATRSVPRLGGGYRSTNQGVVFNVTMKSGSATSNWAGLPRSKVKFPLNAWVVKNGAWEAVVLKLRSTPQGYKRDACDEVLETSRTAKPDNNKSMSFDQVLTREFVVSDSKLRVSLYPSN